MPTIEQNQDDEYVERRHRSIKAQGVAKIKILIAILLGIATTGVCIMAMLTQNLR